MSNIYKGQDNPKPTIYNTKVNETESPKKSTTSPQIKLLREAHVTEITLGDQTLRVMDAGHIQGVINMIEKHHSSIEQLNKTVNNLNRTIRTLNGQIQDMNREIDQLKGILKINGNNYL
ncbi:hypothetical protein SEPL_115 [Salmonella phage SE_PL]|uniref:hypothetical protein n=1 Tax=Salmonella enterica TaxID=28901 RepID=UPI000FDF6B06|nr:hypothetical protein CPT_Munch_312 [Salmonella phage Munch]EAZ2022607.1 hypothetical protein [Salmonella enterica]ECV9083741.1 hypothetical protein [Salmonella enterica subsp. enterica serovar Infantis]MCP0435668.1 hypothetical protein [Salmonella enterica subsp. enterica serovar Mbandaka]QCW19009.1 hypothetical protein 7t3_0489 [Salmonella phage 7t3]QIG62728.1 hypothetical protein SEPL_115 [Salmonella phage SE_PL]WNV47419.1 hypothetical protein [Klebsiella phage fENko-Kae01]